MSIEMKETDVLVQGTVVRKSRGHYLVQQNGRCVPCSMSNRLRKHLIYPSADPASLGHHFVQAVRDIDVVDPVAVGDRVEFMDTGYDTGHIVEVLPRKSQLSRLAAGSASRRADADLRMEQVLVANVDQVVAVFAAARPKPKWNLLDRYLVTAEASRVPAVICITKLDLVKDHRLAPTLARYQAIGYPVLWTSTVDARGIETARAALTGKLSVLMGKSGVGKTSLLNAIEPGLGLRVRAVSSGKVGKGRHTTTHLELFPLAAGGGVVDTPGIRELGLWNLDYQTLADCFPEMRPYLGQCKFGASCRHDSEPGCAIKQAVDNGDVDAQRYENYLQFLDEV